MVDRIQYETIIPGLPELQVPISPNPMSSRTEEQIVELIATQKFAGGQRLIESDLAHLFGLSRVPVREALRRLETQGIVRIVPHRGAHVTVFDDTRIARVAEARYGLEVIATRDAMRRIALEPALIDGLDQIIWEMRKFYTAGDRMGVYRADIAYHTEVCRVSANDVVSKLWEALSRNVLICFGHMTDRYPDLDDIVRTHLNYRSFLTAGDIDQVEKFVAAHIGGLPFNADKPYLLR